MVEVNMFPVAFAPKSNNVYHYDVEVLPTVPRKLLTKLFSQLCLQNAELAKLEPVFDHRCNMYTSRPLKKDFVEDVTEVDDPPADKEKPRQPRKFRFTIKLASEVDVTAIASFVAGRARDIPRKAMQALDIAMRYNSSLLYQCLGRAFFYPEAVPVPLSGGVVMWEGHYQSLRLTQNGLMLNVDTAATTMVQAGPLHKLICERLEIRDLTQVTRSHYNKLRGAVRGLKVQTTHCPRLASRQYRITGLAKVSAIDDCFTTREGVETNVVQYFQTAYNYKIRYPRLPCVRVGSQRQVSLPIEVCVVQKGIRHIGMLNTKQRTGMVNATCLKPRQRKGRIMEGLDQYPDPFMKQFGLKTDARMSRVPARQLQPPAISFNKHVASPRNGSWPITAKVRFQKVRRMDSIMVFYVNPTDYICPVGKAEKWFVSFLRSCQSKGLGIPSRAIKVIPVTPRSTAQFEQMLISRVKSVQIAFFLLGADKDRWYNEIKRVCETRLGLVSQCLDASKIKSGKANGVYQVNVALKVNAKLGGVNFSLTKTLPVMADGCTMLMGADVHHPPGGNVVSPSIAAVVASFGRDATQYNTAILPQRPRLEVIQDMQRATMRLLKDFYAVGKVKPKRIIMFRDGVGEGHFEGILAHELAAIKRACLALEPGYAPAITFIIVQKRNHVRCFPMGKSGDRNGNPDAGTVIDSGIVHPVKNDFFLYSHSAIKGTSVPTHYHVLWDENKLSADQMQKLVFEMCHVYARCSRSVSMPAPAYYAHLAAYRARLYANVDEEASETLSNISGSTGGGAPCRVSMPPLVQTLNTRLFYV